MATRSTEYEAVRTATGIWDLYSTCKYEVTGPDAARLIQRRFTNSLEGMADGSVRYGAFVNADGLMVDDGNVYKFADDHFLRDDQHGRHRRLVPRDGRRARRDRSSTRPTTTR